MDDFRPTSRVYHVLVYEPAIGGVAVKIVIGELMLLMFLLMLAIAVIHSVLVTVAVCVLLLMAAVLFHVLVRRAGRADPKFVEVVVRYLLYPNYLGPR